MRSPTSRLALILYKNESMKFAPKWLVTPENSHLYQSPPFLLKKMRPYKINNTVEKESSHKHRYVLSMYPSYASEWNASIDRALCTDMGSLTQIDCDFIKSCIWTIVSKRFKCMQKDLVSCLSIILLCIWTSMNEMIKELDANQNLFRYFYWSS